MLIDAQVHAYAAHSAQWPWANPDAHTVPAAVTGDDMVAAMDGAGVDRAILVSTWTTYRTDTRYAESVHQAHPDRFRLVAPLQPTDEGVAARVESWAATPGAVGVRLLFLPRDTYGAEHPGVAAAVRGAAAAGLVVNVHCWGRLATLDGLAQAFPDAQFVLDHLGLEQPSTPPVPNDPFGDLDQVLALARHPNLAVKLTGVCTYSRRPFPYDDLWEPVGRVIEAFGIDRCLWGTDWQRTTRLLTYEQGTSAFRDHWPLTEGERAAVLGGNASRLYSWPLPSGR
jgi:L-fuconolactonase